MSFAGETDDAERIIVNGKLLNKDVYENYIDLSFKKYDINALIKKGKNEIVFEYTIPEYHLDFNLNECHDSLRNIFILPIEIESIYIIGKFKTKGNILSNYPNYLVTDNNFSLVKEDDVINGDVTSQGYYFYNGNVSYKAQVEKEKEEKVEIILSYDGACASISINNNEAGLIFNPTGSLDITNYLDKGMNDIKITVYGSLRNMLGAHHHKKGEVEYTGVHTFTGEYGNDAVEDLDSIEYKGDAFTSNYSFIKLGLNNIKIRKTEIEE